MLNIEDCVIYLIQNDMLVQTAAYGIKNPSRHTIIEPIVIPLGEGIVGTVAQTRVPEIVPDTRLDPRYISDQFAGCSEMTVPIVFQGTVIGVLDSEAEGTDAFCLEDLAIFQAMAGIAASRIAWFLAEQERLVEAKDQQIERLESLGRLAGGVAHDFNNLLMVIGLNIELASGSHDVQDRQESTEIALMAVEHARGLTKQLTTFARGGEPLRSEVEMGTIIADSFSVLAAHDSLRVTKDIDPALPTVWGDRSQLSQVVQNLLINAAQAMKFDGHIHVSATAQAGASGQRIVVCVQDNGPGIPTEVQQQIFDPYFSTKDTGSGLGLATAYWIVRRHEGELTMCNAEGGGALFSFSLPVLRVRIARSPTSASTSVSPLHILILDDQASIATGLRRLLVRAGHTATAVMDGAQVASLWLQQQAAGTPFDLAILDLVHPGGVGGKEALARLRAVCPQARAIVMSGYSDDEVMAQHRLHGFNARLSKPFLSRELDEALRAALECSTPSPPPHREGATSVSD